MLYQNKDNSSLVSNRKCKMGYYRPVSILPVVSKLIERIVFNKLYQYLNSNNLLTDSQSGFRPMFSTETALLEALMNGCGILTITVL